MPTILLHALASINWLQMATEATTLAPSILPLLVKTAIDASQIGSDPAALMRFIQDLENDIGTFTSAVSANNAEVGAPAPAPEEPQP